MRISGSASSLPYMFGLEPELESWPVCSDLVLQNVRLASEVRWIRTVFRGLRISGLRGRPLWLLNCILDGVVLEGQIGNLCIVGLLDQIPGQPWALSDDVLEYSYTHSFAVDVRRAQFVGCQLWLWAPASMIRSGDAHVVVDVPALRRACGSVTMDVFRSRAMRSAYNAIGLGDNSPRCQSIVLQLPDDESELEKVQYDVGVLAGWDCLP